ncbi:hypothetical protein Tco_0692081 [Tanacetum coccineum]
MEQKQICCGSVYDRIPPLSPKHVWLVAQNLEAEEEEDEVQIFYNVQSPFFHYRCRIPELLGKRICGCFFGWVVLSNHPHNVMWSLWNPLTSKFIYLPPLIHKQQSDSDNKDNDDDDDDNIGSFCLSSPPDDAKSILLMTNFKKPNFLFCRLHPKRKKLRWTEMSYAKQVTRVTGGDDILDSLTCLQLLKLPMPSLNECERLPFIVGTSTDLFSILIVRTWKKMETSMHIMFIGNDGDILCSARLLEGGDDIQEEDKNDKIVLSIVKSDEAEFNGTLDESHLLNLPFDVLMVIMEFSVGVEYMKFRASCKLCHLAAPIIQWNNHTASKRLQLVSPWLMVIGKDTITFIDPMFGDKYFIKMPRELELIDELKIHCSRYGWLLMRKCDDGPLILFNPLTGDTRKLPKDPYLESFGFSAPPTSPGCMHGETVEVFIPNKDAGKWEKIDDIGKHMIYVGDRTSLCMEAKTREMENKIYFPRLRSGKIVPLTSLDEGLYALACEEDVRCLATLVRNFKLIEVYIEHGVTVLDPYLRAPRFRATLEDITDEPGSIAANRTEKMLLLTCMSLEPDVNLNVSQVETQSELLVSKEPDVGRTQEPILAEVSIQEPIVAEVGTQEPIVAEVSTEVPIVEEVGTQRFSVGRSCSDGQFFFDDEGINIEYDVQSSEDAEPDVDVYLFGISMDLPFDNIGVTNLVSDDVLEGDDVDVFNLDGFDSDPGNDEETNYRKRMLAELRTKMEGFINASGQWKYSFYTGQKFTTPKEAKDRVYMHSIESRRNLKLYKNDGVRISARCDEKVSVFTMSHGDGPTGPNRGMEPGPSRPSGLTTRSKKGRI